VRYRIEPIRAALRPAGHWFAVEAMPRTVVGRLACLRRLKYSDVVIVQRRLISPGETALLRRSVRHLIFDFDDAVFQKDSYHPRQESPRRMKRFQAMVRAADQVFAGNEYLAESAARHTQASKIKEVPTCVNTAEYTPAAHRREGSGVRVVWIGSSSTLRGLELQQGLWERVSQALPGLEFRILCDRFPEWKQVNVVPVPWDEGTEREQLAKCDIGLAWLPDDAWSRGKCGLKVLQYMAAGLPVVTNPVGVHRQMVRPGVTGFWAMRPEEWITALGRLMRDAQLRSILGRQGRGMVEQHFGTTLLVKTWKASLRQIELSRDAA
jgi:glycosyltransferase involved in cell wall biosynthesis